jgi:hypothetical protein
MPFEGAAAVRAASMLLAVGVLLSTLEALWRWRDLRPQGLASWRILSLRWRLHRWPAAEGVAKRLLDFPGVLAVYGVQGLAALALLGQPWEPALQRPGLLALAATLLLLRFRDAFGEEGSDQMNALVAVPLALHALAPGNTTVLAAALTFIALQSCLAYLAAGVAKAASPWWRSGEALSMILHTESFGSRPLAAVFRGRRWPGFLLAWSVIGMECLFPLCLVLPEPWFWIFLVWGALFHLYCAVTMGLNAFLWAFTATYPALLWLRQGAGLGYVILPPWL